MNRALFLLATACAADGSPGDDLAVFAEEASVCATGPTVRGIDVSKWQGSIDWGNVAAAGIEFAFIRTNHGLTDIDERFDANWSGARDSGVIRGAYQYYLPQEDALAQADLLLERMGPLAPGDLPPVIDVEERGGQPAAAIAAGVRVWSDRVESVIGRKPIIYTGKYFWQDSVASGDFTDHPLWVAQWNVDCPDLPAPWPDWRFHQTSSTGSVSGISGAVDTDLFNGSRADLETFAAGCGADCPRCDPIPPAGRVVDDLDLCFDAGGSSDSIRTVDSAGWEDRLRWTYTTDWADEDNYGMWTLDISVAGPYLIELFTPAPHAQSKRAVYQVRHAGIEDGVMVDQSAVDGWTTLGEFDFAAGPDQWLRVADNTGEPLAGQTKLVFDAVRVTPAGSPDPDPDPDPDPGDPGPGEGSDGGLGGACAVTAAGRVPGAGGVALFALWASATAWRRSRRGARSRSGS